MDKRALLPQTQPRRHRQRRAHRLHHQHLGTQQIRKLKPRQQQLNLRNPAPRRHINNLIRRPPPLLMPNRIPLPMARKRRYLLPRQLRHQPSRHGKHPRNPGVYRKRRAVVVRPRLPARTHLPRKTARLPPEEGVALAHPELEVAKRRLGVVDEEGDERG